ncbi:helix-turn-helix domain-containing protein [Curtobacterium sp. MCBA15_004]|uniref:helix-turn-helix domain-containing protein n=1 Tax=unclassified Curtobacterium TaxID=257496 RepID=UPI0008DDC88F|nr:helix-turn-helix domain-containing protein [Curtobacterium sp. MCBA15_004]WIA97978.1 helix-turn-helix domain-containing protein [Curtobacterium sp. MCBA15_004]
MTAAQADVGPPTLAPTHAATPRTVHRGGSDPDDARALYEEVYDARDVTFTTDPHAGTGTGAGTDPHADNDHPARTPTAPFTFRYRCTGDDHVTLRTSSVSAHRSGVLAPDRQYVLAWSVEGGVVIDPDREDGVTLRAGVPVMCPAGRPFAATAPPGTVHLVHFDADFLEAVAVVEDGNAPVPLAFPVSVPSSHLAPLQAVLREVAARLLDETVVDGERAALDLRLAEAVLQAFRPERDGGPPDVPVGTIVRAKSFMYAHFARPLATADIAAAAEVSVRTLQETFQRREGTTPTAFLRDLRLEKARLALQLADVRETSVAAVAHSCGFRHMGRFSGAYAAQYGEFPGATLRGQRRLVGVGGPVRRASARRAG